MEIERETKIIENRYAWYNTKATNKTHVLEIQPRWKRACLSGSRIIENRSVQKLKQEKSWEKQDARCQNRAKNWKKYLAQTKWSHLSFTLCHYIFPFWTDHMSNEENCLIEGRSTSFHSNHWLFCKYERYPVHVLVFASEWKHDWWLKALHSRGLEGLGRILLCFRNGFNCQT